MVRSCFGWPGGCTEAPSRSLRRWLAGPRALELAGRTADGWVPSFRGDAEALVAMGARLDDGLEAAGRPVDDVRRVLNINGTITGGASEGPFKGPTDQWIEELIDPVTWTGEASHDLDLRRS